MTASTFLLCFAKETSFLKEKRATVTRYSSALFQAVCELWTFIVFLVDIFAPCGRSLLLLYLDLM